MLKLRHVQVFLALIGKTKVCTAAIVKQLAKRRIALIDLNAVFDDGSFSDSRDWYNGLVSLAPGGRVEPRVLAS